MSRPVQDQVVVITGASSGIGRETALAFAEKGAALVLAARGANALATTAVEAQRRGGRVHFEVTDVAEWHQVQRLAQVAVDRFGRIDTWVNNAAVALYGTVDDLPMDEMAHVIAVNLLGTMQGCKAAIPHLKAAGGGTIVNVGSVLSERAIPLQSAYSAAKQGIKGFSDGLRLELEHDRSGIAVTLIEPASINTPFFRHARSHLGVKPRPVPPAYTAREVARAIVFVAEHPRRTVVVGGAGKVLTAMERLSPSLADATMRTFDAAFRAQKTGEPDDRSDNLFAPLNERGASDGEFGSLTKPFSLYTRLLELHPNLKRAFYTALAVGSLALLRRR